MLVASEESLDAVASAVNNAATIGPDQPGKIGGIDRERWQKEKVPIERYAKDSLWTDGLVTSRTYQIPAKHRGQGC